MRPRTTLREFLYNVPVKTFASLISQSDCRGVRSDEPRASSSLLESGRHCVAVAAALLAEDGRLKSHVDYIRRLSAVAAGSAR